MSGKNIKKELILHKWRSKFLLNHSNKVKSQNDISKTSQNNEESREPAFFL